VLKVQRDHKVLRDHKELKVHRVQTQELKGP
jgi:hypothetical protein